MAEAVILDGKKKPVARKYVVEIAYVTGKVESIELFNHKIVDMITGYLGNDPRTWQPTACPYVEYVTTGGLIGVIPLTSILSFKLDKDFSKIVEERTKPAIKK